MQPFFHDWVVIKWNFFIQFSPGTYWELYENARKDPRDTETKEGRGISLSPLWASAFQPCFSNCCHTKSTLPSPSHCCPCEAPCTPSPINHQKRKETFNLSVDEPAETGRQDERKTGRKKAEGQRRGVGRSRKGAHTEDEEASEAGDGGRQHKHLTAAKKWWQTVRGRDKRGSYQRECISEEE